MTEKEKFNEEIKKKTKSIAVRIVKMYSQLPKKDEVIIIGKQLIRSATSMAANYRAVCRARSVREFFAKISITIEETDETLFWLEVLEETGLVIPEKLVLLKTETEEILKILAKARKNTKIS